MDHIVPSGETTHTQDLLERVRAATGPDRELDARIYALADDRDIREAIGPDGPWRGLKMLLGRSRRPPHDECVLAIWHRNSGEVSAQGAPHYTASLDAALALVERVLPDWAWSIGNLSTGGQAYLMRKGGSMAEGKAATPPLAVLAALLVALGAGGVPIQHGMNKHLPPDTGEPG